MAFVKILSNTCQLSCQVLFTNSCQMIVKFIVKYMSEFLSNDCQIHCQTHVKILSTTCQKSCQALVMNCLSNACQYLAKCMSVPLWNSKKFDMHLTRSFSVKCTWHVLDNCLTRIFFVRESELWKYWVMFLYTECSNSFYNVIFLILRISYLLYKSSDMLIIKRLYLYTRLI